MLVIRDVMNCKPGQVKPMVEKFRAMKRDDSFSTTPFVARKLAELAFDPAHRPDTVRVRFPPEKG